MSTGDCGHDNSRGDSDKNESIAKEGMVHALDTEGSESVDTTESDDQAGGVEDLSMVPRDSFDTITMEVTVDTSEMDDRDVAVLAHLADLYEESFAEVVAKNRDYGWSFLRTGAKLAASDGTPFDQAARSQAYGLLTRAGDKRERIIENVYGDGDASVSDPPAETAQEAANYYLFLAFVLRHPELAAEYERA